MKLTVLTYNVLFNRALTQLKPLLQRYNPDLICLQEIETSETNLKQMEILNYKLADFSNSFIKYGKIWGVATYFNYKNLKFVESDTFILPRSFYEIATLIFRLIIGGSTHRTVLKTDFSCLLGGCNISVYNIHLTEIASNSGRIKQLKYTLGDLKEKGKKPGIIAGDFNFLPYSRKNLEIVMKGYGYSEATKTIPYTIYYGNDLKSKNYTLIQRFLVRFLGKIFSIDRIKADYIFYKNLKFIESKRIPLQYSDHFPIISTFELI